MNAPLIRHAFWPPGRGEMSRRVREHDWSASPLGASDVWCAELKTAVSTLLDSGYPTALVWGAELTTIYNDAFRSILGGKDSIALGTSFASIWQEVWPQIEPFVSRAFAGEPTFVENYALLVDRSGHKERAWFTFSYSPIRAADGTVLGMVDTVMETTGDERIRAQLQLGETRFRALATAGSYSVYRMSADWKRMHELEGRSFLADTDAPNEGWADIYILPEDRASVFEVIDRAISGRTLFELEHRVRRSNGSIGWTLSRAVPLLDTHGDIIEWIGAATDVTERRHARDLLRESDARLSAAFDVLPVGIGITDADGTFLLANKEMDRFIPGRVMPSRDGSPPTNWLSFDADGQTLDENDFPGARALRGERVVPGIEMLHRPETGRETWVSVATAPLRNAAGDITGHVSVVSDIDDLKRGRDSLRDNEAMQAFLLALGDVLRPPAAPHIMARTACRLVAEKLAASSVRYTCLEGGPTEDQDNGPAEAAGEHDPSTRLLPPGFPLGVFDATLMADLQTGRALILADARGDPRLTDAQRDVFRTLALPAMACAPLVKEGRLVAVLTIASAAPRSWTARDVALLEAAADRSWRAIQYALAEGHLRDSEQRLRVLMEGVPQLVWRADIQGAWTWASPQWSAYTGQVAADAGGGGWLDAVHPGDRAIARSAWDDAPVNGLLQVDHRIRHAGSGHYHWFQTRGVPVRAEDGRILEWLGTCTDINDQMEAREVLARSGEELERQVAARTDALMAAEKALRQSEKLTAIGQLTGGIAHDFNNLVQALSTGLELIRIEVENGRTSNLGAHLNRAERTAERAAALTHRMLTFARQGDLEPQAITIDRMVLDMEDLVRRSVGPSTQVELRLAAGNWTVWCDLSQIENALLNLCINARDAMPDGGWLMVGSEETVLTAEQASLHPGAQPGRYIVLSVRDTGNGIPPDVLDRVFEPFFTTKPIGAGTGLGLSQVYGFVHQSNGFVTVETCTNPGPERGTTVRMLFPFHAENPDQAPDRPTQLSGPTLLLVEDQRDVRELLAEMLQARGYRVFQAEDGPSAVRLINSGAALDLLLTDQGLPGGMTGLQLIDAALARRPGLPTVLMTGFLELAVDHGLTILRKPFKAAVLLGTIEMLLTQAGSDSRNQGD